VFSSLHDQGSVLPPTHVVEYDHLTHVELGYVPCHIFLLNSESQCWSIATGLMADNEIVTICLKPTLRIQAFHRDIEFWRTGANAASVLGRIMTDGTSFETLCKLMNSSHWRLYWSRSKSLSCSSSHIGQVHRLIYQDIVLDILKSRVNLAWVSLHSPAGFDVLTSDRPSTATRPSVT